ncbi:MAG: HD domain-containing protein [Firmicutes bacterium]|nr:HD domain-containing protein [Bacillota bacterium]
MLQTIAPGSLITLTSEAPDGFEFYYIVSGSLVGPGESGQEQVIGRGQSIVVTGLTEEVNLRTETGVTMVYVSSRPVFHQVSEELARLMALARRIEEQDPLRRGHCERMRKLALAVGEELHLPVGRLEVLGHAAYLHDVGLAEAPLEVLVKPDRYDERDWECIRQHPVTGRRMVEKTYMLEAGIIIEQHHERPDGKGYPHQLTADRIVLEAAIVAVVDAFDAMTTDRPYRSRLPEQSAVEELRRGAGTQFVPEVVEALIRALERREHAAV